MTVSSSQAMQTLTAQYYNALTTQLQLDPNAFQLAQGNIALGSTSQALWTMMDQVPSTSVSQIWTPGTYNSFSSNFGSILSRVHSASSGAFQAKMGDYYPAWMAYLRANPPASLSAYPQAFQTWAMANMDPGQAQTCLGLLNNALIDPIGQAQQMWLAAGNAAGVKAYQTSIEVAGNQIASAPTGTVTLNSSTQSSDTTHTWAHGSVEGFFSSFFGGAQGSYDQLTTALAEAGLSIDISFTHVATLPVSPLQSGTVMAGPTTYPAWYVPGALQTAYKSNNYEIWQPGSPDWNSFFGPNGTLLHATRALIVVDGIRMTLTSNASISDSNRQSMQAAFEAGFFPFFGIKGQGGWSSTSTYDDSGRIVVTNTCATGNPQVLGVLAASIENTLAAAALVEARNAKRVSTQLATPGVVARPAPVQHAQAALAVTTAWTARALQGLHNLGLPPAPEQLIVGMVNTWANNNANQWPLNVPQQYVSGHPAYTATAQVVAINGGNRTVNVTNFV